MKKFTAIMIAIALSLTGMYVFTACGIKEKNDTEPLALSLIIGAHQNFPKISASNTALNDIVYDACESYGSVTTVVTDGNPSVRGSYNIVKIDKQLTESKLKAIAMQNTAAIISECASAKAIYPEVDLLAAIKAGASPLTAINTSRRVMCIYDSGICTAGLISQIKGDVLSSDPQMVVDQLRTLHALPDLSGVVVRWVGLGCTAGMQCKVPDSYMYKLEVLWTMIIEASGGNVVFDPSPVYGQEGEDLPKVTPVPFPEDSLNIDYSSLDSLSGPIVFNENTIKFVGDRAEFTDRAAAMTVLKPIAMALMEHPEIKILIAGTTASVGTEGECISLSVKRAEACRDILVEYGVKSSQIECIGLGRSDNFLRVNDLNSDGILDETMAALNRAIYIFTSDSDSAKRLLGL